ncbi:hypothetical protein Pelo_5376 [Pelomyxa schiedti]|nr:hypothetical protein Pelo_5376 [Pelomyxa schiedti]
MVEKEQHTDFVIAIAPWHDTRHINNTLAACIPPNCGCDYELRNPPKALHQPLAIGRPLSGKGPFLRQPQRLPCCNSGEVKGAASQVAKEDIVGIDGHHHGVGSVFPPEAHVTGHGSGEW